MAAAGGLGERWGAGPEEPGGGGGGEVGRLRRGWEEVVGDHWRRRVALAVEGEGWRMLVGEVVAVVGRRMKGEEALDGRGVEVSGERCCELEGRGRKACDRGAVSVGDLRWEWRWRS